MMVRRRTQDDDESADMAIIVCHAAVTGQPAKSAMKKAWSRRVSEEREGSRLARRQLKVRFSLPAFQSREDGVEEDRLCVYRNYSGKYCKG